MLLTVAFLITGTFKLTIEFTEEYPNKPPTVRFVSKMFHPNGKCLFLIEYSKLLYCLFGAVFHISYLLVCSTCVFV